ncbi:MAG TPA: hypothetical protein GXZ47_09450 [Treponema sp.]|nr:hypothetical protein [Treponema sp.]
MTIQQQPHSISLSGNMLPFIINSGALVNFTLKDGANTLIESTYEPDSSGRIEIDVKDIIQSRLKYQIKGNAFYEQTEIVKQFTATIDSTTVNFKVIRCGVLDLADTPTNWLKGNFLTWQPQQKAITYYSPEWLTYYATEGCTIKLKAYFPESIVQNVTLGTCGSGRAFSFNLQYAHVAGLLGNKYPTHYDVWAETSAGARLSFIQRYYFSEVDSEQEQWFLFENSLGGLDTLRASGETDLESTHEHKTAIVDGEVQEYKIDTKRIYTKNTGHLTDYERRWLMDFPPARAKYIHHSGAIRKIVVLETPFNYAVSDSPTDFTFKYRFTSQSSCLNLIRSENLIPTSITIPNIDAPGFFLPPRLSEYPRTPLHEGVILPAFDPHTEAASVTTVGAILSALVFEVIEKVSAGEAGGELVNILRSTSGGEPSDYSVFSSLRASNEIRIAIDEVLADIDFSDKYLSKIDPDTANGLIKFLQGLEIGDYTPGFLGGGGAFKMKDGISELEVDKLTVRMVATFFEIVVSKLRHINGGLVLSRGAMTCSRVVEDADSYQCFFERGENNEISNTFVVNDQARCQVFNAGNQKFYWRLVTAVGDDWIRLSKTVGIGDSIPTAGDDIVQLGYQGKDLNHVKRLNAQIIDESGISQYVEIDSFTLEGKRRNFMSADGSGSQFTGKVSFVNAGVDYDLSDWAHETETAIQDAETTIQEAVEKIAPPVWVVEAVNIIPNAPTAIFRRGKDEELHQLTLVAKFTRDGIDVTDIMNQSGLRLYEFERRNMWGEDDNGNSDSAWNLANKGRTQVTLTHEDIVFIGNINMRFNDELLETEYQKLK